MLEKVWCKPGIYRNPVQLGVVTGSQDTPASGKCGNIEKYETHNY
jgi:hypothetical protein